MIGGWNLPTTQTDQSDISNFKKCDLQVAKYSSNFAMAHKMGLVKIVLGTKTVPTTRNYSASGSQAADATGMKYTDSGTTTVTASNSFDTSCSPYSSSGYWYIVRGSKAGTTYTKTFKSVSTVNTDWEYADVSVDEGNYQSITVQNTFIKRLCYKFTAVFSCTRECQSFKLPVKGTITMQCWGASATEGTKINTPSYVGRGGYVKGDISSLDHYQMLYVYVGSMGVTLAPPNSTTYQSGPVINTGGYNGGGDTSDSGDGGGGATDVRLAEDNLYSRIIVAGGGGGLNYWNSPNSGSKGGDAGGLYGPLFEAKNNSDGNHYNYGGNTTKGGIALLMVKAGIDETGENGSFGQGGSGYFGGGGGGWFGGSGGSNSPSPYGSTSRGTVSGAEIGGGGGSSFISGFSGCKAYTGYASSTDNSVVQFESVQYKFSNTEMWDGAGYKWNSSSATSEQGFPPPSGSGTENGHLGDGYAKITMTSPVDD